MGIALKAAAKTEFEKKYTQCPDIGAANGKHFQRSGTAVRVLFTPTYLTVPVADLMILVLIFTSAALLFSFHMRLLIHNERRF
jgi:hypothetical protein